jgi:glycosyltransferase involved in cell wall biosynthesis
LSKAAPKVSIVMPAYNAAPWIAETISSLLAQTFEDFELLIGDDGSTDNTKSIIEAFAIQDSRVTLHAFNHSGVVAARNALLQASRGHFVMFHDADDLSVPERMHRQVHYLQEHSNCVGVSSNILKFNGIPVWPVAIDVAKPPTLRARRSTLSRFGYHKKNFPFPACMVRTKLAQDLGGFRPYFSYAEDADFIYRLEEKGELAVLDETLFLYRQHAMNTSKRAPYLQTEASVLSRTFALRRRRGKADTVQAWQPPFKRIFTSGLSPVEILQTLVITAYRYGWRRLKNAKHMGGND